MTDILQAARSYYGLADAKVRKTEWFTDEGKMILCFEIVVEGEDFIGIVERMKRLQEERETKPDLSGVPFPIPNSEELRKAYNALSVRERSKYSSFAHFAKLADTVTATDTEMTFHNGPRRQQANQVIQRTQAEDGHVIARKVAHIDAPETEEPAQMDAVWIKECDIHPTMYHLASDYKRDGRDVWCLMQVSMLTEEQRQKAKESKP